MHHKIALLSPVVGDAITYGVGGAGVGALLAALTSAYPRVADTEHKPRGVDKVVPKRIIPQPVYVDADMAHRLAARGITVHAPPHPQDPVAAGKEDDGIDPMQKVALEPAPAGPEEPEGILGNLVEGTKQVAPWMIGLGALSGGFYGVNKLLASRVKDQAKTKYVEKRKQLNNLLASMNTAGQGDLQKVAFLDGVLPWLIGAPFVTGGALAFGDGYKAAVDSNPNIKTVADLDKFYADLPDTPKLQLTPVLREKKKRPTSTVPPDPAREALRKVAGFSLAGLGKAFTEVGKHNDLVSVGGGLATIPAAVGLSSNIDDPTYKWMERGMMPLGVGAMLNRRLMGHTPVSSALKGGMAGEAGLFGGLRFLDNSAQAAKASQAQAHASETVAAKNAETADKALKYGLGGAAGLGVLGLGGMAIANRQQSKESTRARRSQSRQLRNILSTIQTHRIPGDLDGDGDVDEADREALAATAGVTAPPITGRRHIE